MEVGFALRTKLKHNNDIDIATFLNTSLSALGQRDFSAPIALLTTNWFCETCFSLSMFIFRISNVGDLRLLVQEVLL